MGYFVGKAIISGLLIAAISTLAKRSPALGALVASLPLVLLMPALMRAGVEFYPALGPGAR